METGLETAGHYGTVPMAEPWARKFVKFHANIRKFYGNTRICIGFCSDSMAYAKISAVGGGGKPRNCFSLTLKLDINFDACPW